MDSLELLREYMQRKNPSSMKCGGKVKKYQGGGIMEGAKAIKQKYDAIMSNIGMATGAIGGVLGAAANQPDMAPQQDLSEMAGAFQGASIGSKFGPLGIIGGAVLGKIAGKGTYLTNQSNYDTQEYLKNRNYMNNHTVDQSTGYYQQGGGVQGEQAIVIKDGNSYFTPPMPMGLKTIAPNSPYQHIQTEKGEMMMMMDGGIVPTKATKLHKNMKKDEVTDIVPVGTFVFSDFDKKKLKKEKLDKIKIGHSPVQYSEDGEAIELKESSMGDHMTKAVQTPAEIAKNILSKFPISSRKKDIFADITNEQNRVNRLPYLAKLVELNGSKKTDKQIDEMKMGGKVKKYQLGDPITNPNLPYAEQNILSNPDLADQILNSEPVGALPRMLNPINIASYKPYIGPETLKPSQPAGEVQLTPQQGLYGEYQKLIDNYKGQFKSNTNYGRAASAIGHGIGALGSALQSARVDPQLKSTKFLRQSYSHVPQYLKDYQVSTTQKPLDTLARNLGRAGYNGNQLQAILSGATARTQDATNRSMYQYNMNDVAQDQKYNMAMQGVEDFNNASLATAGNEQRGLENAKLARTVGYLGQGITRDASLRSKGLETQYGLDKQLLDLKARQMMEAEQAKQYAAILAQLKGQ